VIGPGVSFSCEENDWLHVNADHFLMEVVDPQTGEPLAPGEQGELVFTTLQKEAFPVIRFRTRDLAVESEEICRCGRTLPRHSRILGRTDDMIKVKGVMLFPRQIEEAIMRVQGASENYQIVKISEGSFQGIRVLVEPLPGRSDTEDMAEMAEAISREIYSMLSVHVDVRTASPGSIPRSAGKAKRVTEG